MSVGRADYRRADIQGLRSVSAFLVAAFHIWFSGLSGGVDVFFVVAGFFVAQSTLRRIEATGRPGIAGLWSQLASRLFPHLIISLCAVLVLIFVFLDAPDRRVALQHVMASAFYVENWYLVFLAGDPANRDNPQQLTEHLWALGAIAQASLVLPLVFPVGLKLAGGDAVRARRAVAMLLATITLLFFVYGYFATAHAPDAAYYGFFPRLWQFSLGATLAVVSIPDWPFPGWLAAAGSWLGLLLILTCGVLIGNRASFPGLASLWPTAAGALIVAFGRSSDPANAGWLLTCRPLPQMGDYSYGFYIWHWPFTLLALNAADWQPLSWSTGGAIIVGSFLLSVATERVRSRLLAMQVFGPDNGRRSLVLAAMLVLIAAIAGLVLATGRV